MRLSVRIDLCHQLLRIMLSCPRHSIRSVLRPKRCICSSSKRSLKSTASFCDCARRTTISSFVVASLKYGFDLIIDEVEDHFHKTLVENMLSLYKDKSVNRHNATLIFTTHYCEVLDLFNRQDNIWISKANGKVFLSNMYDGYDLRPELLKSKQFYKNAFQTSVNYEDLMKPKKELMRA